MQSRFSGFARMLVLAGAALLFATPSAMATQDQVIDVTIDFAKVLTLDRPAATIVIGNPGIADASVSSNEVLVLTGKTAGTTNLIVIDEEGEEVLEATLRVSSDIRQLTTVFFGTSRETFSCAPVCEKVISVGDNEASFDTATSQIEVRQEFATGN